MELEMDLEPPEKRVLSWLSQSLPASFEYNARNLKGSGDFAMSGAEENDVNVLKELSRRTELCNQERPNCSSSSVRSGLHKYFLSYDSEHSSVSGSELLQYSPSSRLYCDEERKLIVQYIVEKKLFSFLKGNNIWKQMEKERICGRTWQSMKTQFHRYIYPNLKDFALLESDRRCFVNSMERSPIKKSPGLLSPGQRGWRKNGNFYTFHEDSVIIYYVLQKNRYEYIHGNALWKRMECKHILPGRSWHSIKSRYKSYLSQYVEKYVPKQRGRSLRNRLGSLEKVKLMHDFLYDHLIDMSVTVGIFSPSDENAKKLNNLGLDCTFSVPLPRYNSHGCERDNIRDCVIQIKKQLFQKFNTLYKTACGSSEEFKSAMYILDPKYGPITDVFKQKEGHNHSDSENNFDLSESVRHGLRISTPKKGVRKLFQTGSEKNRNKLYAQMNSEKSTCDSTIKLKLDTCNKTLVNCQKSTSDLSVKLLHNNKPNTLMNNEKSTCDSSSQITAVDNVCKRNGYLSEEMQTDAMDIQTYEGDEMNFLKDVLEKTHFQQWYGMSVKEYFQCTKVATETIISFHNRLEAMFLNLSELINSETKRCEVFHQDTGSTSSERTQEVCTSLNVNESSATKSTCTSPVMDIKNLTSVENLQSLKMLVDLPLKLLNVSASIPDCTCSGTGKKNSETKETNMLDHHEVSHQEEANEVYVSVNANKSASTSSVFDITNHTSKETLHSLEMHVDLPIKLSNVSASNPDSTCNGMEKRNTETKETDRLDCHKASRQEGAKEVCASVTVNKNLCTSTVLDITNHTSEENMQPLVMHVDEPMNQFNLSAFIPDCIVNDMEKENSETKEMHEIDPANQNSSNSCKEVKSQQIHVDADECVSASMKCDEYVEHNLENNMNDTNNDMQSTAIETVKQTLEDAINQTTNKDNINNNCNDTTNMLLNCNTENVQNSEVLFHCGNSNNDMQSSTPYECATENGNKLEEDDDDHLSILEFTFSDSSNSDIVDNMDIHYASNPSSTTLNANELENEEEEPLVLRLESDDSDGEY